MQAHKLGAWYHPCMARDTAAAMISLQRVAEMKADLQHDLPKKKKKINYTEHGVQDLLTLNIYLCIPLNCKCTPLHIYCKYCLQRFSHVTRTKAHITTSHVRAAVKVHMP